MTRGKHELVRYNAKGKRIPVRTVPFREWPWHARMIEKLYRATHHGQIRTLIVRNRP